MDALIDQVKHEASKADEAGRKRILSSLRDLSYSIELPEDTMQRVMLLNLQISGVRVGINLKLFNLLSESKDPMTVEQLAAKTGAEPLLLGRLLRYLASVGMIKETGKDSFTATNISQTFAVPGYQAGIRHYFDTVGPMIQTLPGFLEDTGYRNITDNTKTVLQPAWKTEVPAFIWFQQNLEAFNYFNQYMAIQREGMPTWLSVFPVEELTKNWKPEDPVFVDVGGGFGHQCLALRGQHPQLPGRVILQDLPPLIEMTKDTLPQHNVEAMVHDFFQPQVIKGAKFYYLRNILHDYPDDRCRAILTNLKEAMSGESLILIDDMVLPNSGVHWQATQQDLTMMSALASMERTKEQWYALLDSAGLQISKIYTYTLSLQDSIIVATPK